MHIAICVVILLKSDEQIGDASEKQVDQRDKVMLRTLSSHHFGGGVNFNFGWSALGANQPQSVSSF